MPSSKNLLISSNGDYDDGNSGDGDGDYERNYRSDITGQLEQSSFQKKQRGKHFRAIPHLPSWKPD